VWECIQVTKCACGGTRVEGTQGGKNAGRKEGGWAVVGYANPPTLEMQPRPLEDRQMTDRSHMQEATRQASDTPES
jgi:hypothetical protein